MTGKFLPSQPCFEPNFVTQMLTRELFTVADLLVAIFLLTLSFFSVHTLKGLDGTLLPHVSVLWGQS